jgi:hypothetical protein
MQLGWQRLFRRCQPSSAARGVRSFSNFADHQMANSSDVNSGGRSDPGQAWASGWHLWRVIIPRRSITGRLVWGLVWRRNRGGQWIYKRFVEYS